MSPRSALYYPHTHIRSAGLLRTALLTWDRLEFLVPWEHFGFSYKEREFAEAVEVIGRRRFLSGQEKGEVHSLVEDLLKYHSFDTLTRKAVGDPQAEYSMWGRKLGSETWRLLAEHDLATIESRQFRNTRQAMEARYGLEAKVGLLLMAMMADVAAGETRSRITDEADAYATIANFPVKMWDHSAPNADEQYVVGRALKTVGLRGVPLRTLINLRQREEKEGGQALRQMRHAFLDAVSAHVSELGKEGRRESDQVEMTRVFDQAIETDYKDLKRELGFAALDSVLSHEVLGVALVTGAGVAALMANGLPTSTSLSVGGTLVSIGGALMVASKFGARRAEILKEHPSAYLYEIRKNSRPHIFRKT